MAIYKPSRLSHTSVNRPSLPSSPSFRATTVALLARSPYPPLTAHRHVSSMATESLNLNVPISHEDENPSKTLDSTDTSIVKPDGLENTPNSVAQAPTVTSTDSSLTDGTEQVRNGASKVVPVGSAAENNEPVSDVQKKIHRAERFGMPVKLSEEEKRNTRAERFSTGTTSRGSDGSKKMEDVKRKARAERFGLTVPPVASEEEAKKKARLARFAPVLKTVAPDTQEEDKRKARALRFSNSPSDSLSQVNGKEDVEQKAAIAGNPGGVV